MGTMLFAASQYVSYTDTVACNYHMIMMKYIAWKCSLYTEIVSQVRASSLEIYVDNCKAQCMLHLHELYAVLLLRVMLNGKCTKLLRQNALI